MKRKRAHPAHRRSQYPESPPAPKPTPECEERTARWLKELDPMPEEDRDEFLQAKHRIAGVMFWRS